MDRNSPREYVCIADIRSAIDLILDNVESQGFKEIAIDDSDNFYWAIDLNEMFDVRSDSVKPDIGSIQDSSEFLRNMIRGAEDYRDAPPIMLVHLAPLLYFISHKIR